MCSPLWASFASFKLLLVAQPNARGCANISAVKEHCRNGLYVAHPSIREVNQLCFLKEQWNEAQYLTRSMQDSSYLLLQSNQFCPITTTDFVPDKLIYRSTFHRDYIIFFTYRNPSYRTLESIGQPSLSRHRRYLDPVPSQHWKRSIN